MKERDTVLGIDAGSIFLSVVEIDRPGNIVSSDYLPHHGKIAETLKDVLLGRPAKPLLGIAVTSSTSDVIAGAKRTDNRVACITAAKKMHGNIGSLLVVGGEKYGVATFDEEGYYLNYRSNSSCAAGTGSFLDQQARRLGLEIGDFATLALGNRGDTPRIASRCAVFAKTDLIHAQQVGHSLEEICDGLCLGLARNIRDTLFSGAKPRLPFVMAGGVAQNRAVVRHLEALLGVDVTVGRDAHLYGALGAALGLCGEVLPHESLIENPLDLLQEKRSTRSYHYPPLELSGNSYPDFNSLEKYEFVTSSSRFKTPVEVDVYEMLDGVDFDVFLGIDVGSTSTKAAVVDREGKVLAGLYTRTSGRPVEATQNLLEALDDIARRHGAGFRFLGAATTGSGRKFIARIIGADLALDEITAHARAALKLDPGVDTIIEIGGQDAKYTLLRDGRVTFSIMNNVCAAGTGSFIEEQAKKLNCPLDDYSRRAAGARSPLSSDRCTVFMERDLNYYLGENYAVEEVLASVLHSVRDNYLLKVAGKAPMGDKIFFQGATAKNRALVAAFEQKLGKNILVSKFCHITGAYGAALTLCDEGCEKTDFRGLFIHRNSIPVKSETCGFCANHCKLAVAEVEGETVAFGFLCGRDYDTKKFVRNETSVPDLLKVRKKALRWKKPSGAASGVTVGLPAALHLAEELELWKMFFAELGITTVDSEGYHGALSSGKERAGAEFCAPMAALHGHVHHLLGKADYVFLPVYLEVKSGDQGVRRHYCYYTQYAPIVVSCAEDPDDRSRIIMPVVRGLRGRFHEKVSLYRALEKIRGVNAGFLQVSQACDRAYRRFEEQRERLKEIFRRRAECGDIEVLFLGRPYAVLSPSMNGSIPDIFARLGVRAWYQDMVDVPRERLGALRPLLEAFHWNYAAAILKGALVAADTAGLYPVLVTSFKCTPDSYVIDYFREMMDAQGKPYLVLQLDEHDSSVGYETRIEAGVRAFRNHFASSREVGGELCETSAKPFAGVNPRVTKKRADLAGRALLLPNWDGFTGKLLEANLRRAGFDARLLEETEDTIRRGLRCNTGQCLPLSAIVQGTADYIEKYGLQPSKTALWLFDSSISCNVRMFPYYVSRLLDFRGLGEAAVYVGEITFLDMPLSVAVDSYFAYMFGGLLRKALCKIRPYEVEKGSADRAAAGALGILEQAFADGSSKEEAARRAVEILKAVPVRRVPRPKVAIFGDLYVRDNDVMNQDLARTLESLGAEVVTTPYSDYMKIIADPYIKKWVREGLYGGAAAAKLLQLTVPLFEKKFLDIFREVTLDPPHVVPGDYEKVLAGMRVSPEHTGESMDNVLKIFSLIRTYPDIALFVQTNPSYCCPALVTEAMAAEIERVTGVPVVTLEYDGTGGARNGDIIPYLKYLGKRPAAADTEAM